MSIHEILAGTPGASLDVPWKNLAVYGVSTNNLFVQGNAVIDGNLDVGGTITGTIVLTNKTPNDIFVSTVGDDTTGNGAITSPYLTVTKADSVGIQGQTIEICNGAYSGSVPLMGLATWQGFSDPKDTFLGADISTFQINDTIWQAQSEPYKSFLNLEINGTEFSVVTSSLKSGSQVNITNCIIDVSIPRFSLVETINFKNSRFSNPEISDCSTINIDNCIIGNSITIIYGGTGTCNVYLNKITMNGAKEIDFSTTNTGTLNVYVTNSPSIIGSSFNYDDSMAGGVGNFYMDGSSSTIINAPTSIYTYTSLNQLNAAGTDAGLAMLNFTNNQSFAYSGTTGNAAYTLLAGRNAHITFGTDNILFGRSTSSRNECFVYADQSGPDFFPSNNQTFICRSTGGVGFNTDTPQAAFHASMKSGGDGNAIISSKAIIADGNLANYELNPSVTANNLIMKWKDNVGAIHYTTQSLSTNYLFGGGVSSNYTSASTTISSTDLVNGQIMASPTAPQILQLPSASAIDGSLTTKYGFTIPPGTFVPFTIDNISTTGGANTTLTNNTGVSIVTNAGTPIINVTTSKSFKLLKNTGAPTFILYGN